MSEFSKIMASRKLLRESNWLRVYSIGESQLLYESKFLVDNLEVSANFVAESWGEWSEEERWEFAYAFGSKGRLSAEDEQILNFLMRQGNEVIWSNMAMALLRHSAQFGVEPHCKLKHFHRYPRLKGDSRG